MRINVSMMTKRAFLTLATVVSFHAPLAAQPVNASAPTSPPVSAGDLPGMAPVFLPLISPAEAEVLYKGRIDRGDQNKGLKLIAPLRGGKKDGMVHVAALAAPAAPIPASVAELARALKYDPVLIYEFVHNNIEYLPVWGLLKGSEGAITDGVGTSFDIAQLTADLINADPGHVATATLVRGTISIPATTAASWLSLNGMNVCPLANTFASGGIPTTYSVSGYPDCRGATATVTIGHVWVKVAIGGIAYEIDPGFKAHTQVAPSVDLPTVTGYNRTAFLTAACTSCNTNPNVVTTLNRSSILNPSNTHSYPKYARNLLSYLQANNIHDLSKVIGGYKTVPVYPTSLPAALPYTVASRIADPFTIDGTWKAALLVNFNGISQLFSSDAIYGKRLSITFNSGNFPQLNLDGTIVQTGTSTVTPGASASVNLSMCLPFSSVNCSVGAVDGSGKAVWCGSPPSGALIQCGAASILSGGTYAVTNSWGPVSHNMVQRHRIASIQATNAGLSPGAEANLGETLTTMGFSYSEQDSLYLALSEDGQRNGGYNYLVVGIAGHTGNSGGPYIDLRAHPTFPGMNPVLNGDGTYTANINKDSFLEHFYQGSVLESTSVNQLSGVPSLSTAKLLDIGISQTASNEVYDLRSCADYNTYNGLLVSYTAAAKSDVQSLVCSQGYRVVLPRRGNLTDSAITTTPKWTGAGYYAFPYSGGVPIWSGGIFWAYINGGYAGGYSGAPQNDSSFDANSDDNNNLIIVTANRSSGSASSSNDGGGGGGIWGWFKAVVARPKKLFADPVDQATGAFINHASDISTGEIGTARLIGFERSYTTGDILASSPLGQGWKDSLDIFAQTTSDVLRPTGAYDAWDAAEMLAVKMVNRDLMSDASLPVVNIAVSSIGNRWLGDRLVNNIVAISGSTATAFSRLADDSYNPGQYSAARLTGAPSAWTIRGADGTTFAFNAADATGVARIGAITQPMGIVTTFNYTNPSQTIVSNNLGRRLNINWVSGKITSVTDTPLLGAVQRTVTFTYNGNLLQQATDTRGGRTLYCYDSMGRMTSYYLPTEGGGTSCAASGAHIINIYDSLGRVKQQTDGGSHVTDLYLAGTRSEMVTHPGGGIADTRTINYLDNFGNVTREISPRTGLAKLYAYDALSRLVRTDLPEGNAAEISYDIRSNPIRTCAIPKIAGMYPACDTSAGSTHIWTTTAFAEGPSVWNCTAPNTCNKASAVIDSLGNTTTSTYYGDGQINTVTFPVPAGYAGAPKSANSYTATASLAGNINLLTQRQVTASAGSPPSIVTTFGFETAANGLTLKTATLDPSGLNLVTTYGFDGYGNQISARGPRTDVADTVITAYDNDRNPVTITYPNPGSGSPITQIAYNANGWVTSTAGKLGSFWMVSCTSYTASGQANTNFGPFKTASPTDCSFGGNTAVPNISYGYDGADRLISTIVAEPSGNRITRVGLFPDNRVQTRTVAFGTTVAATETASYTNNGLPNAITDARGNISGMVYDGFDRLALMKYPLVAGGGPSTTDVVGFSYDKRSAMTRRSIRGTSDVSGTCTQCIVFTYDEIGRMVQKTVPAMAANGGVSPAVSTVPGYSVYYGYDLISRLQSLGYSAVSPELTYTYDNASRLTQSVQYGRAIVYNYAAPAQGLARTLIWPASVGTMLTCTDALGRISQIKETADCTTTTGQLVGYGYDDLSRRISTTRPSGANSSYSYEDTGTLDTLGHALTGGSAVNYSFDYNRALQMTSRTTDNNLYAWTNNYNVNRTYNANGLDQYGQILGDSLLWDTRGNLLTYRGSSYSYDGENRLAAVAMPQGTVTTVYDPAGRLRQTAAATLNQFVYDGTTLIAEYGPTGTTLSARYIPGPGVDETAVAYDGTGTKSWYHADAQGSVVATSDAGGAAVVTNQYGSFGEPGIVYQGRNAGRVRYTGQALIPELGLYNYKARLYAPKLGRFLQTDPIGAADDRNLYAYVGNDPINRGDSSGLAADVLNKKVIQPLIGHVKTHPVEAIGTAAVVVCALTPCGEAAAAIIGMEKIVSAAEGGEALTATTESAFSHSYSYDARVLDRALEDPVSHNFPYSFDDEVLSTNPISKPNGYNIYQQPGSMNGTSGNFEIGVNNNGVIDHRFFRPGP